MRRKLLKWMMMGMGGALGWLALPSGAWAEEASAPAAATAAISGADTAFVMVAAALVMVMTPGLGLFYGGMVRRKNVLATFQQSFILLGVVALQWVLFGYSLAFGPDVGGVIGSLEWFGLSGVGGDPNPAYGSTIPHQVYMLFQLMFAAITPALVTGAFAERMRFSALLVFAALWSTFIYCPLAHWIWGGGWLAKMGALDFAGGAVVHISSGWAALACALVLGKRKGYGTAYLAPHNLPMTLLGAGLLWFGWFGFNAGSALGANALAASAFLATNTAAAMGALSWMVAEWLHRDKPTTLGAASGAIAGLATITPAAGFVGLFPALLIGLTAGVACYAAVVWKGRFGYDDSLDVVGIHGVGGAIGIFATGLFASKLINPAGANGLFFGNPGQVFIQLATIGASLAFALVGTFIILKLIDWTIGLRVDAEEEERGLDLSQHEERAYS